MQQNHSTTVNGEFVSYAMRSKSEAGFLTGAARLGYVASRSSDGAEPVLDNDLARILQEAFVRAASGLSVRQVTAWLAGKGIEGVRGGPITKTTVQRMLTEPFYAGFVQDDSGRLMQGRHQALVSPHIFAQVQRRLLTKRCAPSKTDGTLPPVDYVKLSHLVGRTRR